MLDISKNTNFYREFHEVFTRIEKKIKFTLKIVRRLMGHPINDAN